VSWLYEWWIDLARALGLPAAFQYPFVARGVVAILLVAPLLGGLSHLIVARRLAFFSAALGQAALTGLTIGLVAGEPIDGVHVSIYGFCLACAIVMVYVRRRATLPTDTVIGVFMAFTLGLGVCLLVAATRTFNIHQIEAVMFGSLLTITDADLVVLIVLIAAIGVLFALHYNLVLADSLHPALGRGARTTAILEYLFVVVVTFAITVSLKVIGALLVEAMVVVPAAAGRNVARSVKGYLGWSIAVAVVAGIAGLFVSTAWRVPTGGAIVLALSGCFVLTLVAGAIRGR
jgi:zinc transport system permease protein